MIKMHSGGCQCGAVRYRINGELIRPHICHCRMCQKAAGNYFMSLAGVAKENLEITRGEISWFLSSDPVRRGFCSACGTPLAIDTMAEPVTHMTLGSLDDPESLRAAKRLLSTVLRNYLGERPLKTRAVFEDIAARGRFAGRAGKAGPR